MSRSCTAGKSTCSAGGSHFRPATEDPPNMAIAWVSGPEGKAAAIRRYIRGQERIDIARDRLGARKCEKPFKR